MYEWKKDLFEPTCGAAIAACSAFTEVLVLNAVHLRHVWPIQQQSSLRKMFKPTAVFLLCSSSEPLKVFTSSHAQGEWSPAYLLFWHLPFISAADWLTADSVSLLALPYLLRISFLILHGGKPRWPSSAIFPTVSLSVSASSSMSPLISFLSLPLRREANCVCFRSCRTKTRVWHPNRSGKTVQLDISSTHYTLSFSSISIVSSEPLTSVSLVSPVRDPSHTVTPSFRSKMLAFAIFEWERETGGKSEKMKLN